MHEPSSRPVLTCLYLSFFFLFFSLKLSITLFSYFVIQSNIKIFEKKKDSISRLFNVIAHYMNELAL